MRVLRIAGGATLLGALLAVLCWPIRAGPPSSSGAVLTPATTTGTTTKPPSAPPAVSVFPIPGSQVAPRGAQIVFRGVSPYALTSVQVSGSMSGNHAGQIQGDSDGNGASFVPSQPFTPGEIVTVSTSLNLVGAPSGSYQFRVANAPGPIPPGPSQDAARRSGDVWSFHSRPDLHPASSQIVGGSGAIPPDQDLFLTPQYGPLQDGPMILDANGKLVYFKPMPGRDVAADLRVQDYLGQRVLTWWQGYTNAGVGLGQDEIYNSSYQEMAQVHAADGLSADLHEFLLTPQGTALIVAYYPVYWDSRAVGGKRNQIVLDSVVQEIDIPTGLELFQWDSLDHVPVQDSEVTVKHSFLFDYFHVNSVDLDSDGNLIVSARNTWAAYKINHSSGAVMWTLGGKQSSFRMGPGASFAFQHDVRLRGSGDRQVSLFDDGAGPPTIHHQSRGLMLRLNLQHKTASVVSVREHSPPLRARFQGNVQQLPGGGELIGWGQQPYFTEFGPAGRVLMDARFVANTSSYRAYAYTAWTGQPSQPPAVAATDSRKGTIVYASWNGSTQTAFWQVMSGTRKGLLFLRKLVRKTGFETPIDIPRARWIRVEALDAQGNQLAGSAAVPAR